MGFGENLGSETGLRTPLQDPLTNKLMVVTKHVRTHSHGVNPLNPKGITIFLVKFKLNYF